MSNSKQLITVETKNNIAVLRMGAGDQNEAFDKVPVLNETRISQLEKAITEIKANKELQGLVFIGSPGGAFCAGADITAIQSITDSITGKKLAERGQKLFAEIEELPIVTVAAINGACVGGGYELALSCNYRVSIDSGGIKIGLPETMLGILPGFGGTQRLPRLIGLPRALDVILAGKVLPAPRAYRSGLVDKLLKVTNPSSIKELEDFSLAVILGQESISSKGISVLEKLLTFTPPGRMLVRSKSKPKILKQTKGHYPAPLRALDVVLDGLSKGLATGYELEAIALGELIATSECKSLVHLYFLTENAKRLGKGAKDDLVNLRVGVVGGGVMGAGIASSFLAKGVPVVVVDPSQDSRTKAKSHIEEVIQKKRSLSDEQKQQTLQRLVVTGDNQQLRDTTVVIEAAVENMKIKKEIFANLATIVGAKTILATNTSSLSVSELAPVVSGPERVIGMHFFNPVEKMPLVEIIRSNVTDERTLVATAALTSKLGKHPVIVEDVSGFLVNRILTPYLVEAAILLSEGYSEVDIDSASTNFGMPMGPVRLLDEVGLDIGAKVNSVLFEAYGERMDGPRYADKLVSRGRLGRKSGAGFYKYQGKDHMVDPDLATILDLPPGGTLVSNDEQLLTDRLILRLVNEAVLCLDEGVSGVPGKEAAEQIDLASVMGTGFAPFRGGVIHYAQTIGVKTIYQKLKDFSGNCGVRFEPSPGIKTRAEKGLSFYEAV